MVTKVKLLDREQETRKEIFEYFGYAENYRVLPLDDARECYWKLDGEGPGNVLFAEKEEDVRLETGNHYSNVIYTQRFLQKWVYRGKDFTMIVVDTHIDMNQLLQIFDNAKEVK